MSRALLFDPNGGSVSIESPPAVPLARGGWGMERVVRSAGAARIVRTLEDSPFYSRSLVETTVEGVPAIGVHESLDLGRFSLPWVQALIPFRAPRRG
jgi:carotenoid 1,2-hydratase